MQWVRLVALCVACSVMLTGGTRLRSDRELVVFETQDCPPCMVFRRDVVRPYFESGRGLRLPMQVVDYDLLGTDGRGLKTPIDTLPTTVIMEFGREIGRVKGHPGAGRFMLLIDGVMAELFSPGRQVSRAQPPG